MNIYRFYVYAYIRHSDSDTGKAGTPYYIGKGQRKRVIQSHGKIPVPKNKKYIIFLETNLSNIGALALERRYIKWYGRKDKNTGILLNMSDGGEGGEGVLQTKEANTKRSIANKGRVQSIETRKKRSNTMKGRSSPLKNLKQQLLECPHCNKVGGVTMLRWHFAKCRLNPLSIYHNFS
jgi:hypothetical protein